MTAITDSSRVPTITTDDLKPLGLRVSPACLGGFCSRGTPLVSRNLSLPVPPVYTGLTSRTKRNQEIDSMIFKKDPLKPKDFLITYKDAPKIA